MITTSNRAPARIGSSDAFAPLVIAAVVLAAVSVLSLAALLLIALNGGTAWAGLSWIPMIGLPLAFVLMIGLVAAAVRRRRLG